MKLSSALLVFLLEVASSQVINIEKTVHLGNIATCYTGSELEYGVNGEVVTYCYEVTNTGNVGLEGCTVTDSQVVPSCSTTIGPLGAGVSTFVRCLSSIDGTLSSSGNCEGTPVGGGSPVTDSDAAGVEEIPVRVCGPTQAPVEQEMITLDPTVAPGCPVETWNFNDLTPGQYIHDEEWDTRGIKVTAIRKGDTKGYTPIDGEHVNSGGGAMVLDTLHPTRETGQVLCNYYGGNANDPEEGDKDLGAPNKACPGGDFPGEGKGGKPFLSNGTTPNPFKNCAPLGNVLVIQEKNKPCPDDSGDGGWIQFDFKENVFVQLAKLLDIDNNEDAPEITLTNGNQVETMIKTSETKDNGLFSQPINLEDITRIKIEYFGSGSIAELQYSKCPPPS